MNNEFELTMVGVINRIELLQPFTERGTHVGILFYFCKAGRVVNHGYQVISVVVTSEYVRYHYCFLADTLCTARESKTRQTWLFERVDKIFRKAFQPTRIDLTFSTQQTFTCNATEYQRASLIVQNTDKTVCYIFTVLCCIDYAEIIILL